MSSNCCFQVQVIFQAHLHELRWEIDTYFLEVQESTYSFTRPHTHWIYDRLTTSFFKSFAWNGMLTRSHSCHHFPSLEDALQFSIGSLISRSDRVSPMNLTPQPFSSSLANEIAWSVNRARCCLNEGRDERAGGQRRLSASIGPGSFTCKDGPWGKGSANLLSHFRTLSRREKAWALLGKRVKNGRDSPQLAWSLVSLTCTRQCKMKRALRTVLRRINGGGIHFIHFIHSHSFTDAS